MFHDTIRPQDAATEARLQCPVAPSCSTDPVVAGFPVRRRARQSPSQLAPDRSPRERPLVDAFRLESRAPSPESRVPVLDILWTPSIYWRAARQRRSWRSGLGAMTAARQSARDSRRECGDGVGDGNSTRGQASGRGECRADRQVGRRQGRTRRQRGPDDRGAGRGQDRAARPHADHRPGRPDQGAGVCEVRRRVRRTGGQHQRERERRDPRQRDGGRRRRVAESGDRRRRALPRQHRHAAERGRRRPRGPLRHSRPPRPGRHRPATARSRHGADRVGRRRPERESEPRWRNPSSHC